MKESTARAKPPTESRACPNQPGQILFLYLEATAELRARLKELAAVRYYGVAISQ